MSPGLTPGVPVAVRTSGQSAPDLLKSTQPKRDYTHMSFVSTLTPRQQTIVDDVLRFGQMRAQQITRLHFYKNSEGSREKRMRETMLKLTRRKLVSRIERDIGMGQHGSSGYIYQAPDRERETPSKHALATSELYVRLREAERAGLCEIGPHFYVEAEGYYKIKGTDLRQDIYTVIRTRSGTYDWNIEVDRDTEHRSKDRTRLIGYRNASEDWTAEDGPVFPTPLYVVPNTHRLATIERRIQEARVRDIVRVCLFEDAIGVLTA